MLLFFSFSSFQFFLLTFGCNPQFLPSFMFQVILFAAHAVVDALYSGRNSATHPNFDTVKQYLQKVIAQSYRKESSVN